jgi:putative SOS response-associated peptidase YedK
MCGRVVQARGPLQVAILCGLDVPDTRFANVPPRYNAAPSQELWAIRQNNDTGQRSLDVSFHQVVPPVLSEEAGVAKLQHFLGGPDERSSECPAHAAQSSRTGAAGGG